MVSKGLVGLLRILSIAAGVCELGNCSEYTAVYDADGRRQCAVGMHQPDEVRPSTNTMTFECARLCDDNPECVVFNLYDNTTCEIFTCSSMPSLEYQIAEPCKSFRINDCKLRCTGSQIECEVGTIHATDSTSDVASSSPISSTSDQQGTSDIKATTPPTTQPPPFRDCEDVRAAGHTESGVYLIKVGDNDGETSVYCDLTNSENWLVFQRRFDGSDNFDKDWAGYANGFGNLNGEFWLGNKILYNLLANRNYTLRIDMEDWHGNTAYAEYSTFSIASASYGYALSVGGYNGTAGDSSSCANGGQFATWDRCNYDCQYANNGQEPFGGWWYNHLCCPPMSNLNGVYKLNGGDTTKIDGIVWYTFRNYSYSLYKTDMKIGR